LQPYFPGGFFFDFRTFCEDNNLIDQEFSPQSISKNGLNIEEFIPLEEDDFLFIKAGLSQLEYLKEVRCEEGSMGAAGFIVNQDVMAGLLDYYNSRSTSFASLVVGSIFGLVTLLAVIQSTFKGVIITVNNAPLLAISIALFFIFSFASLYTVECYFHYATVADKIKTVGIQERFFTQLNQLTVPVINPYEFEQISLKDKISRKVKTTSNSIIGLKAPKKKKQISLIGLIKDMEYRHSRKWLKRIVQKSGALQVIFSIAAVLLFIFVYWDQVIQLLRILSITLFS
jgi:hypothetical protein